MKQGWEQLAQAQSGMFSRAQLTGVGVTRSMLRAQLAARRWRQRSEHVFSATTGPLSWEQRLWLAALHAGPDALVGGLGAAKVHGMKNWERDEITVLVDDQLSFEPWPVCASSARGGPSLSFDAVRTFHSVGWNRRSCSSPGTSTTSARHTVRSPPLCSNG